jgi:hypothetical protein
LLRLLKKAGKLGADTVIIDGVTVRAFGVDEVGCGADHQLAEGAAATAGVIRPARCDHRCLDDAGGERHLLPYPASRRLVKKPSFVRAYQRKGPMRLTR